VTRRRGKTGIPRHKRGIQGLTQRNVNRVVGRDIVAQFPNARKKELVGIPDQRHISQICQRFPASPVVHLARSVIAAQHLRNFYVNQVGSQENLTGSEKTVARSL